MRLLQNNEPTGKVIEQHLAIHWSSYHIADFLHNFKKNDTIVAVCLCFPAEKLYPCGCLKKNKAIMIGCICTTTYWESSLRPGGKMAKYEILAMGKGACKNTNFLICDMFDGETDFRDLS